MASKAKSTPVNPHFMRQKVKRIIESEISTVKKQQTITYTDSKLDTNNQASNNSTKVVTPLVIQN